MLLLQLQVREPTKRDQLELLLFKYSKLLGLDSGNQGCQLDVCSNCGEWGRVSALVDTGVTHSFVCQGMATELGLNRRINTSQIKVVNSQAI